MTDTTTIRNPARDFVTRFVAMWDRRLPKLEEIPLLDVAIALNTDPKKVKAWWEAGEIDAVDLGAGKRCDLVIARQSLLEFAERRALGLRLPATRRLPRQLEFSSPTEPAKRKGE